MLKRFSAPIMSGSSGNRSEESTSQPSSADNEVVLSLDPKEDSEITIKVNMSVFQTLLETTADDLLNVVKANRKDPEQPDEKVRGDILRELYNVKEILISKSGKTEQLESTSEAKCDIQFNMHQKLYTTGESWATQPLHDEPEPSMSSQSLNSAATADLDPEHSEQEYSIADNESSPQVGQKRSCKNLEMIQPPAKRQCTPVPLIDSSILSYISTMAGSSSASRRTRDDAVSSKKLNVDVVRGASHAIMDESANTLFVANSSPSGQTSIPGINDESSATLSSLKQSHLQAISSKHGCTNLKSSNIPAKNNITEYIQHSERVKSKCGKSSKGLQKLHPKIRSQQLPCVTEDVVNKSNGTRNKNRVDLEVEHSRNAGVTSQQTSTAETPENKTSNSQASNKKRYSQSLIIAQKSSQADASCSLLLNPTKGQMTRGKTPYTCKAKTRQGMKGSHSTSKAIKTSSSMNRKRGSRCPKSKSHLCPVCGLSDCGECKNCLYKRRRCACKKKPIKNCITYRTQKNIPQSASDKTFKRQRSKGGLSEAIVSQSMLKKDVVASSSSKDDVYAYSSPTNQTQLILVNSSSSDSEGESDSIPLESILKQQSSSLSEDDAYAYSSPATHQTQTELDSSSSSSDSESDSESHTTIPQSTAQKEPDITVANTNPPDQSSSSLPTSSDDSQPADPGQDFLDEALKDCEVEICAAKCGIFGPPGTGKSHFKAILSGRKRPEGGRQSTALATEADQVIPVVDIDSEFDDDFLEMHTNVTQSRDGSKVKWYVTDNRKLDGLVAKTLYKQKRPNSSTVIQERPGASNIKSLRRRVLNHLRKLIQNEPKVSRLKCLKGIRLIYIVDTGGQPQFQEIMPIFVRSSSIHFLVHKLNEPLDEFPQFDYEIGGVKYTVPEEMLVSNKTYIEQSLRTISSCVFARNGERYTCGSIPKPQFAIIGMFKDKCRDTAALDKKRREVKDCIQPYIESKKCEAFTPSRHNEKPIFSIDGSEEGWSSNGNIIDDLHTNIENFTKSVKIQIPVRWFLFLNLLKELQSKRRPFLSIKECEDMAKKEDIMMNDKEDIVEALNFFDELNLVLYFSKILPNVVFISPAFLFNKVSEIIVQSFNCATPNTEISSEDRLRFRATGIFKRNMLQKVKSLQKGLNNSFSQDDLLELLKQLCIIADITSNQRFFIPCALALERDDVNSQFLQSIIDRMHAIKVEFLMISFPDGYSPRGLFCASVAFLAKLPNWAIESTSCSLARKRNLVEFEVSECTQHGQKAVSVVPLGNIVIVDRMSHIEVYSTCDSEFLCDIRRNINEALWYAAAKCLAYSPYNIQMSIGFSCDCGQPKPHGTAVQDNDDPNWWMKCSKNPRKRAMRLNDQQLPWFTKVTPRASAPSAISVQAGSEPTLALLMDEVATKANKWEMIALHLDIDQVYVERVDHKRRGEIEECFYDIFAKWQKQLKPPFTWSVIIDALSSPSVRETALAENLRKKYLP